jgi:lysophospholipase L1-like esterase
MRSTARSVTAWIVVNAVVLAVLLAMVELVLQVRAARRDVPFNGDRDGVRYTWGHPVRNNRFGFRGREFATPKPPHTYRVMVVGDSLTWGPGLAPEERFTERSEVLLRRQFPDRDIEVLNFGSPGHAVVHHRDTLRRLYQQVQPDLVVVGFCFNDTQPRQQNFGAERERLERALSPVSFALSAYERVAPLSARRVRDGMWIWIEWLGLLPHWTDALNRTYQPGSREWSEFTAALSEIRQLSDEMGLPPPIFTVLNQGSSASRRTYYSKPDPHLAQILQWYRKGEAAARAAGFRIISHDTELTAQLDGHMMAVNSLDAHPGAELHRIYADRLAATIASEYLVSGGTAAAHRPARGTQSAIY